VGVVHVPVLLREVDEVLRPERGGVYLDATVGLGGHAEHMLRKLGPAGRLIGFDRDEEALNMASARLSAKNAVLRKAKFSRMEEALKELGVESVDGVLFDLGVSMLQLREAERGFSFASDEPLDMRMDRGEPLTAYRVVNTYPEAELARILWEFGEERHSRKIARAIVEARRRKPIETGRELAAIAARFYRGWHRVHPATRTFQGIRIEVNGELEELQAGLDSSARVLKPGGRLAVISYHSLEDRVVKRFMKEAEREGVFRIMTKKPVVPGDEEVRLNPSARSAKLRAAERTAA
jgi:16S rRNA (cytosine1402-N4)-methyltransferase